MTRAAVNILACSPVCDERLGSESLVAYRAVEALTGFSEVNVITSVGMEPPTAAQREVIPVHIDHPNDISPWQLMRYELRQRRAVARSLKLRRFHIVHRITPSGLKGSFLPVPRVPLIIGPLLLSDAYPQSFEPVFRPELPRGLAAQSLLGRIQNGFARRVFDHRSTFDRLLQRAAVVIVGSRTTMRHLATDLHPRCRQLTYAGVEHSVFHPPRSLRGNVVPQLIYVGRLVPYKGIELLLRAAARAKVSCRFTLKIVGGGNQAYRNYCVQLASSLGLRDVAEFVENQPRESLAELYRDADIFCMPSVETYGLAILEAMSSACAVLVSDFNGPGEIVQPGTGLKVALESPEHFVQEYSKQIVRLVGDSSLRAQLGAAARQHVVEMHDWAHIQLRLLEIYDETLSKHDFGQEPTVGTY